MMMSYQSSESKWSPCLKSFSFVFVDVNGTANNTVTC